jgi:hypothetical protein
MFRIRKEQIAAFSADVRARFEDRLAFSMREAYTGQVEPLPEEALRSRIHQTVNRARSYGVDEEEDVEAFVGLTFRLGEHFENDPRYAWAADILRDPGQDGYEKMAAIQDTLEEQEEE